MTTHRAVKTLAVNLFLSNVVVEQTVPMGLREIVHPLLAPEVSLPSYHSSCRIALKRSLSAPPYIRPTAVMVQPDK